MEDGSAPERGTMHRVLFWSANRTAGRDSATEVGATEPPHPGAGFFARQTEYADRVSEQKVKELDATRRRGDIWGKAVLSIGTPLVTALGLQSLIDVFPVHDWGGGTAVAIAVIAFTIAAAGVIRVGAVVSTINEPVVLDLNSDADMKTFGRRGHEIVMRIYGRFNELNGVRRLDEYAGTAMAIERLKTELDSRPGGSVISDAELRSLIVRQKIINVFWPAGRGLPAFHQQKRAKMRELLVLAGEVRDRPQHALERAAMIRAEVRATMHSAALAVTRHQVASTLTSRRTLRALLVIPVGLVIALIAADFAEANGSRRAADIAENKACAELVDLAAKNGSIVTDNCTRLEIPVLQPPSTPSATVPVDPAQLARAELLTALVSRYTKCVNAPEITDRRGCDSILLQFPD